jgi:hypothetical protein
MFLFGCFGIFYFGNFIFGRFATRGVQKHEKNIESVHLGSSQKMWFFFRPSFFSPSLGCLVRFVFIAFFGVS